jgi:hypothetical protein
MPKLLKKYVETECSDADAASSASDAASSGSEGDEYEKDSFIASEDDDVDNDDAAPRPSKKSKTTAPSSTAPSTTAPSATAKAATKAAAAKDGASKSSGKEPAKESAKESIKEAPLVPDVKVFSNKNLDMSKVPPKPLAGIKKASSKAFDFRLIFTNGVLLRKFLEPAAHAVKKMRFVICQGEPDAFTGFKIECHDTAFTLADRGLFECDIESSKGPKAADGISFCVNAESFMEALLACTLKETDICITRYSGNDDKITFESTNNENDVRAAYTCGLVDSSNVDSLDGISIELGFHVNVHMSTLKELSLNAKRCGAPTLKFDLWQATDTKDPTVVHSKMCVGFQGQNTTGSHDFYISTRREMKIGSSGNEEVSWSPLASPAGLDAIEALVMDKKCTNEYDNKKLRLFLNHMECSWVLVHLCTDNTVQPLVLDCIIGGARTKHTVIVAPKETS